MIENPMVIDHSHYDVQCKELPSKCIMCKDRYNTDDVVEFPSGDVVCKDCLSTYLDKNSADFVDDFVTENEDEYYCGWHFDNLSKQQQREIIKRAYKSQEAFNIAKKDFSLAQDRVDFCFESDGFRDYVKERLMKE